MRENMGFDPIPNAQTSLIHYYFLLLTTTYYYLLLPATNCNAYSTTFYYLLLPTIAYYYLLLPTTTTTTTSPPPSPPAPPPLSTSKLPLIIYNYSIIYHIFIYVHIDVVDSCCYPIFSTGRMGFMELWNQGIGLGSLRTLRHPWFYNPARKTGGDGLGS